MNDIKVLNHAADNIRILAANGHKDGIETQEPTRNNDAADAD